MGNGSYLNLRKTESWERIVSGAVYSTRDLSDESDPRAEKPTEREHAKRYEMQVLVLIFEFFSASGMILIKGQFRDGK